MIEEPTCGGSERFRLTMSDQKVDPKCGGTEKEGCEGGDQHLVKAAVPSGVKVAVDQWHRFIADLVYVSDHCKLTTRIHGAQRSSFKANLILARIVSFIALLEFLAINQSECKHAQFN